METLYFSHGRTFFPSADRNPPRPGEGMRKDLEQVFPWMTFYCLRNDRGRISMDFGPRQLAGTNDTSEASNRFHASRLFPSRRHLGMAQGDRL